MKAFLPPGTKLTVRKLNSEVSVLSGLSVKRVLTVKDSTRDFIVTYKQCFVYSL